MSKKPSSPVTIEQADTSESLQQLSEKTLNQMSDHSQQVMAQFGDGETHFDQFRYEHKVKEALDHSARSMIDAGRGLIVIKEHVQHGDWLGSLDRIGIPPRTAQKFMQAAAKFLSSPGSKKLLDIVNGRSKVLELMMLDEDELEQLGDGKTVVGINLDDVDRMSCTELRAALRKAREEHEDQQRVMEDKNKKIDEQSKKINRIRRQEPDETVTQMRTEISAMQSNIEHDIRTNLFNAINELQTQEGDDHNAFIESQLKLLADAVAHLQESFVTAEWEN